MQPKPPCVLIADSGASERDLRAALGDDVDFVSVHSLEEAVRTLQAVPVRLIVVGYHFDELRPFRLVRYARAQLALKSVPILMLRALPVYLGATSEAQLREAYRSLGVNAFYNLHDEAHEVGQDLAAQKLRRLLRNLLRL